MRSDVSVDSCFLLSTYNCTLRQNMPPGNDTKFTTRTIRSQFPPFKNEHKISRYVSQSIVTIIVVV